jgi:hypothetical protein
MLDLGLGSTALWLYRYFDGCLGSDHPLICNFYSIMVAEGLDRLPPVALGLLTGTATLGRNAHLANR